MKTSYTGRKIAYFSMEIGLEAGMPTYSGGLGALAGDVIRSAADMRIPMVGVTLLYRQGYFHQRLNLDGTQNEEPERWVIGDFLEEMPAKVAVRIENRNVAIRAWLYEQVGTSGYQVPVYFLDTNLEENSEWDRTLSHFLYGGDMRYRFCQEVILGVGGVRVLRALGHRDIERYHMNEGHSSLLALELLDEEALANGGTGITDREIGAVRKKCVFTTHTPVLAAMDQFPMDMAGSVLGRKEIYDRRDLFCHGDFLNMTYLALNLSHYVNGVAQKHGETSRLMFAPYGIDSITNGVHASTWTSKPFQELLDRHVAGWRVDNFKLRYALGIPNQELWQAHRQAKGDLIDYVRASAKVEVDADTLTLGFARRATAYKRAELLFTDLERLRSIAAKAGPFQVIYAGKAHPADQGGKELIRRIYRAKAVLKDAVRVVYLENYNLDLAKKITAGVDVWLNTPLSPNEASGTSGMKAALNGVPSLSVLDGWWLEGHIENVTGWCIGEKDGRPEDAISLYDKLERLVIPIFYADRNQFVDIMRHCIALNGSFFNAQRMLQEYLQEAYLI
jgi:starch phosphorylase